MGGNIAAPPSKSMAHRAVLCAALAKGTSHLHHLAFSKDISATLGAAGRLCARVTTGENDAVVEGLGRFLPVDPAGLCGNEDCGQMSAWYVFSAMGFYPVNPVSGEYEIGTPLFPEIQMHLDNGKTFTVLAPGVSRENIYIQSVKVNGQPYDKSYITHRQIMDGATVEFEMGPEPGNIWYR